MVVNRLPPITEQQETVCVLDATTPKLDAITDRGRALDQLFNTLLHDLMTGQRRVHELELNEAAAGEAP